MLRALLIFAAFAPIVVLALRDRRRGSPAWVQYLAAAWLVIMLAIIEWPR